jgi:p-hydroxybenzoate 3-monooxygenase
MTGMTQRSYPPSAGPHGSRTLTRTAVGIVGGGPAGLMLSHLLDRAGIDSVVVDNRTREEIYSTARAGILERDSVRMLVEGGVSDRVLREGREHEGIELAFAGRRSRVHFTELTGSSVWLYPQTEVFDDLARAREQAGADVRFGVRSTEVVDLRSDRPGILFTDAGGVEAEVRCRYLVGADGSRSLCRRQIPDDARVQTGRDYPFAWFGILCEAPPSSDELIYSHSARGFALISQRTDAVQRMYFQCDPAEEVDDWSDDRIWSELTARVEGNGVSLVQGPITSRSVLRFRSFVHEPMRHGRLLLAGDAAHTVPPTGAKGLNLALADVRVLAELLTRTLDGGDDDALDRYTATALERVWKAQHFSYWMTTMLHTLPASTAFDVRRQEAELASLVDSRAGRTFLAEGYTGWPSHHAT